MAFFCSNKLIKFRLKVKKFFEKNDFIVFVKDNLLFAFKGKKIFVVYPLLHFSKKNVDKILFKVKQKISEERVLNLSNTKILLCFPFKKSFRFFLAEKK